VPNPHAAWEYVSFEGLVSELEIPFLLVVHLVEGENGKKERGGRGREGRQELRKEGGVN